MKKLDILLMLLLTIVIIRRVEYVFVPEGSYNNGRQRYSQEVKITFEEGVMQIPKKNIINNFIPYGKVKMIKIDTSRYKFIKIERNGK